MSDKLQERVLGVPTRVFHDWGLFQGFAPCSPAALDRLLDPRHLSYRPRAQVETDPSFKQLIPYVLLRWQDQLFHYTRGKRGTEVRLQALRSVGVGGHIQAADDNFFEPAYREGLFREIAEEVHLASPYTERPVGLINDDATPVGQVHLGIVHLFDLETPSVERREQALTRTGFSPLEELWTQRDQFESWSQIALAALRDGGMDNQAQRRETP